MPEKKKGKTHVGFWPPDVSEKPGLYIVENKDGQLEVHAHEKFTLIEMLKLTLEAANTIAEALDTDLMEGL